MAIVLSEEQKIKTEVRGRTYLPNNDYAYPNPCIETLLKNTY